MNQSCEIIILEFLASLLINSTEIREFFLDDSGVRCGTQIPEQVPSLFILYDVTEYPQELVGKGQAYYQYQIEIQTVGAEEMETRKLARTVSALFPTGYSSERRLFTSTIDDKTYSIAPFALESSSGEGSKLQGQIVTIVYQRYTTELYEVR